jgi:hypothetical protein
MGNGCFYSLSGWGGILLASYPFRMCVCTVPLLSFGWRSAATVGLLFMGFCRWRHENVNARFVAQLPQLLRFSGEAS